MSLNKDEASELAQLEAAFERNGGRGVDDAERIDALRRKRDGAANDELSSPVNVDQRAAIDAVNTIPTSDPGLRLRVVGQLRAAFGAVDDETVGPDGEFLPYGRCDTCGAPCDEQGCTSDRSHAVALDPTSKESPA